jgi:hypothetical protein
MLPVLIESIVTNTVRYPKVLRRSVKGSDLSRPLDENPDNGARYDAQKVPSIGTTDAALGTTNAINMLEE